MWTCTEGWKDTDVLRTVELHRQMHRKYGRAVRTGDSVGKRFENVGGCMHAPLLCMHNRWETVVLCFCHILMAVGKYWSIWIRKRSRFLEPARRTKLATLIPSAKAGLTLAGKSSPEGEDSCSLLAHWDEIAQLSWVGKNTIKSCCRHLHGAAKSLQHTVQGKSTQVQKNCRKIQLSHFTHGALLLLPVAAEGCMPCAQGDCAMGACDVFR